MNRKQNQQYVKTDREIQDAVMRLLNTKALSRISVREICEIAKINPSTFYAHYENIYVLMQKMEERIWLDHIDMFQDANISPDNFLEREGLLLLLSYIRKHQAFYRVYLNEAAQSNSFEKAFEQLWDYQNTGNMWKVGQDKKQMYYAFLFLQAGFNRVVGQWLADGCVEPTEALAEHLYRLVPDALKPKSKEVPSFLK